MSDLANPPGVGGPGQAAAGFLFPPYDAAQDFFFAYNYKDSVNISWVSWAQNATRTTMQLFYWAPNFPDKSWKPLGPQRIVSQNDSTLWKLDSVPNSGQGYWLGQWNLNFTRKDRQPIGGLTLSPHFNVTYDDQKAVTTYGAAGVASTVTAPQATGTPPPNLTTAPGDAVTSAAGGGSGGSSSASGASSSDTSAAMASSSSGISGGAIAGIVIGVLAILALAALGGFFFLRRRKRAAANAGADNNTYSPNGAQPVYPVQYGHTNDGMSGKAAVIQSTPKSAAMAPIPPPANTHFTPNNASMSELPTEANAGYGRQELPASHHMLAPQSPQEMPTEYHR